MPMFKAKQEAYYEAVEITEKMLEDPRGFPEFAHTRVYQIRTARGMNQTYLAESVRGGQINLEADRILSTGDWLVADGGSIHVTSKVLLDLKYELVNSEEAEGIAAVQAIHKNKNLCLNAAFPTPAR